MAKTPWTTSAQRLLLIKRYPEHQATRNNPVGRAIMMKTLHRDWEVQWPIEPTPAEIEAKRFKPRVEKPAVKVKKGKKVPVVETEEVEMVECTEEEAYERAVKAARELLHKRLGEWFNNYSRSTSTAARTSNVVVSNTSSSVLSLGPKKAAQAWQAYYSMKHDELAPQVADAWEKHCEENEKGKRKHWIAFLSAWMKERLEKETEEVQAQLTKYRTSYNEFDDPNELIEERNARYLHCITKMPRTAIAATEAILQQTGWASLVLAGGPHPAHGGDLKCLLTSAGENANEETFDEWLGEKRKGVIIGYFVEFLSEKYGDSEALKEWALDLPTDDKESDEEDDSEVEEINGPLEKTAIIDVDKDSGSNVASKMFSTSVSVNNLDVEKEREKEHEKERAENGDEKENEVPSESSTSTPSNTSRPSGSVIPIPPGANVLPEPPAEALKLAEAAPDGTPVPLPPQEASKQAAPALVADQVSVAPPYLAGKNLDCDTPKINADAPMEVDLQGQDAVCPALEEEAQDVGESGSPKGNAVDGKDVRRDKEVSVDPFENVSVPSSMQLGWKTIIAASKDRRWVATALAFAEYAAHEPVVGHLNTSDRPKEVAEHVKSKKKDFVPKLLLTKYGPQWAKWWGNQQPVWRFNDDGQPVLRVADDTADWKGMIKGGTAGLYLVVVSLAWWVTRVDGDDDLLWLMVDDVAWVLSQVNIYLAKSSSTSSRALSSSTKSNDKVSGSRKRPTSMVEDAKSDGPRKRTKTVKAAAVKTK
ncbi:hypothetical protein MD484_g8795, partial [Candolleomyces efflorescens]